MPVPTLASQWASQLLVPMAPGQGASSKGKEEKRIFFDMALPLEYEELRGKGRVLTGLQEQKLNPTSQRLLLLSSIASLLTVLFVT